jgi:hypothetical protein
MHHNRSLCRLLDAAQDLLTKGVTMTERPEAAAACAHALSMLAFFAASGAESLDMMELLSEAWSKGEFFLPVRKQQRGAIR